MGEVFTLNHNIDIQLAEGEKVIFDNTRVSLNGYTMSIDGDVSLVSGLLETQGGELLVTGDIIQAGGTLTVGEGQVVANGDYRIQTPSAFSSSGYTDSSGLLTMQDSAGKLQVDGDFVTESHQDHSDYLTAGQVILKGDFTQITSSHYNFATSETHKVILAGNDKQQVRFESPTYSQFANLQISNQSGELSFDPMPTEQWSYDGDVLALKSFKLVEGSFRMSHDIDVQLENGEAAELSASLLALNGHNLNVNGDLKLLGGALDLGDSELSVTGDLTQLGGVLSIGSGELNIAGDYRIQTPTTDVASGYTDSAGLLEMKDSEGRVIINGDFVTESHNDHSDSLIAGQMTLKGDFTQITSSHYNFAASESHQVILVGEGKQRVRFESPLYSQFARLHIANQSGELSLDPMPTKQWTYDGDILELKSFKLVDGSIRLNHDINVQLSFGEAAELSASLLSLNGHNLTINGDVNLLSGSLDINDSQLTVTGDFTQPVGVVAVGSGELNIAGDYRIQTPSIDVASGYTDSSGLLEMEDAAGRVIIDGDFVTESHNDHSDSLTAGQIILKGDFTQVTSSHYNFAASQSHKVSLVGEGAQRVRFGSPLYSKFANLHIANQSGDVDLSVIPPGKLTYDGDVLALKSFKLLSGVVSLNHDISVQMSDDEVAELSDARLLLNGYNLTINGGLNLTSGSFDANGGKLSLAGDLIQSGGSIAINDGQLSVSGDYRIQTPSISSPTGYADSSGLLTMQNEAGRLTVLGDFVTQSHNDHTDYLTAGQIVLKGDFTQRVGSSYNFVSSDSHSVVFSGDAEQSIRVGSPLYSTFGTVVLTNASDAGVTFLTNAIVTELFEHSQKPFVLFSNQASNFPDFDDDGIRDHLDPFPQVVDIASLDSDGDGVNNSDDAFPDDETEWLDSDLDGTGNNADTDDDNDGMSDSWELANGLDPLDSSDANRDADGDNVINLDEYRASTNPQNSDSDGDGILDGQDSFVGTGLWGYACNVVNDPSSSTKRWGIYQYNLADLPNAQSEVVYSMPLNRKIQSVACDPSGENILFSMKDSLRGDYEIYELEVESRLLTQVTDNTTDDVDVTRSRDGRTVAWQKRLPDNRQAIELRRTTESGDYTYKTLASASPFVQPALSPNGDWLAFVQLRPSFFAVMRYDITNNKYKEVRSIVRRKKLYHPSITDDGNKVGWTERESLRRYRVKDMTKKTTVDILNDANGIQHAVLSGDGQHVIYSINADDVSETYLTALETLETQVVGDTLNTPMRHLSSNWTGVSASIGFTTELVNNQQLTNFTQGQSFQFNADGSGTYYPLASDEVIDFTWEIVNKLLLITETGSQAVRSMRLVADSERQYTVSVTEPDGQGGTKRSMVTYHIE